MADILTVFHGGICFKDEVAKSRSGGERAESGSRGVTGWLRAAALAIIMLRAGLGLDLDKLRKLGLATARLAFLPCLCEALAILGLSNALLGLPPAWGGTLGFVIAAVSPAVVVIGMFSLERMGYGVDKGIPSLVVAAASFDDVVAISGFSMAIGIAVPILNGCRCFPCPDRSFFPRSSLSCGDKGRSGSH